MLEVGTLVDGKYKILSEVGHGGMSVVYMAINEKANKTWAIKEVRKDGVLDFEAVVQGLVVETDMLKRLHHPNLPSIIDVIEDDQSFLIVMDYIEGNSLSKTLKDYGAQPQEYVIEWAKQLCDVLNYLHTRVPPIIYRDMKPANVMLKPDGNISLIDFGTAREYKEKNLADTTCLGTIGYAAPEQFGGMGQTDARTDIYCLGATLYHLVTGMNPSEPPYEIHPIRQINPALSNGLEKIIIKCTQRNPDERYQSCAELMYDLEHYNEIDESYRKKQKGKLRGFITAAAFTAVFLAGGIGTRLYASSLATDNYEEYIDQATHATDTDDKVDLYLKAIEVPGKAGVADAYLGLISAYQEDGVFSTDEQSKLTALITNNKKDLQSDMDQYVEVAYETGRLYWYYYGTVNAKDISSEDELVTADQVSRAISAARWFKDVKDEADDDYENKGLAEVYYTVGNFYQTIANSAMEGDDRGKYKELYDALEELMATVAQDDTEREIVRLELCEFTRYSIKQYATSFKADEVTEEAITNLLDEVEECLNSVVAPTPGLSEKKQATLDAMEETRKFVALAYGT